MNYDGRGLKCKSTSIIDSKQMLRNYMDFYVGEDKPK